MVSPVGAGGVSWTGLLLLLSSFMRRGNYPGTGGRCYRTAVYQECSVTRMSLASLLFVGLLGCVVQAPPPVQAPAPSDPEGTSDVAVHAADNQHCAGGACSFACPQGNCAFVCEAGSACDISCAGGNCSTTCQGVP